MIITQPQRQPMSRHVGHTFGCYTILSLLTRKGHNSFYRVRCDCGAEETRAASNLIYKPKLTCPHKARVTACAGRVCRCGALKSHNARFCAPCAVRERAGKSRKGLPESMLILAERAGVTKQAVSAYFRKYGKAKTLKFYGVRARAQAV